MILVSCVVRSSGDDFGTRGSAHREIDDYHYVFSADCMPYMDWQSAGLYESWKKVGSPGRITRLLSCDEDTLRTYKYLDIMPTHITPRFDNIDPADAYAAYNLPGSMLHFMQHNESALYLRWIVKLDADMIIRKPLSVTQGLDASLGTVAAGFYGYLAGVDNDMAKMFIPDEETRSRLAKVGGWEIFHAPDLAKAAPLWFEYTKKVRQDKRVHFPFRGTGDAFVSRESPRPWISEMYGYVFGTAVAGLKHNVVHSCQLYAGMAPWDDQSFDPFLIHYGLNIEIFSDAKGGTSKDKISNFQEPVWQWDKHVELQGGKSMKDKLRCDVPLEAVRFPEVPEGLLSDADQGDSKKLTRGNGEARRVRVIYELMKALNEGVLAYRERTCGGVDGVVSTRSVSTSEKKSLSRRKLPRRPGGGAGDKGDFPRLGIKDSAKDGMGKQSAEKETANAATESVELLSQKTPPASAGENSELRNAWIIFSFLWGMAFSYVMHIFCCQRRGRSIVRRRVAVN